MKRLYFSILVVAMVTSSLFAKVIEVKEVRYAGPFVLPRPLMIDTVNVKSEKFDASKMLDYKVALKGVKESDYITLGTFAPSEGEVSALHILSFWLNTPQFVKATVKVKGLKNHKVYVDGKEMTPDYGLEPATHHVQIKYLTDTTKMDTLGITVECVDNAPLTLRKDGKRLFSEEDNFNCSRPAGANVSPDGKYVVYSFYTTKPDGRTDYTYQLRRVSDNSIIRPLESRMQWMPRSSKLWFTREGLKGRELVAYNPQTGKDEVLAVDIPDGWFNIAPTEDFLLYSVEEEGPKEDETVFEVLNPEDRQKGYRDRSYIAKYDLRTGVLTQITFGRRSIYMVDISDDASQILLSVSQPRFTKRPTTINTILRVDLNTLKVDTLVKEDGFVGTSCFSPDGRDVLIEGSPESFDGIGARVPEGRTPSMIDKQLYLLNIASGEVKPLTADFNPCVINYEWSRYDGMVYMTAENGDRQSFYQLNPKNGKIKEIAMDEELVTSFSVAENAPVVGWVGQSATSPGGAYILNTKTMKHTSIDRPMDAQIADVDMPTCEEWIYHNPKGDNIQCRYYLPADFDATKQYPMIVYYYGGCSPTGRSFGGHYSHVSLASQGYISLVINPSGATGYGQEFSSRHVNTAGEGVADDIIGAVKAFSAEHAYVNAKKIGCMGASYGGFMTMYLQTVTDIFAAAIAHAGISDHSSYWGEGDWGYSYSEVSMANSYPWTDPDLYVKHSPLYNADKVHTPILFLHGTKDNNVPIGESIQMFTALKLLGRETAFVCVEGEAHHILDYHKRQKWQRTMYAWMQKYLKDDPTWWDTLYPAPQM